MVQYIQQHYIEIIGSILSLIYLYLSIKQKISLWIFGFLCSALYIVVFFQSKFYADMSLQFYYLAVSVFGWISWRSGKQQSGKELPVKRTKKLQALVLMSITTFVFLLYYFILTRYTDSPLPLGDSLTTALSITATWMLARKLLEHWILWVIVDGLSAGLYLYKGLYPTAILFIIYTVMAIVGWYQWKKDYTRTTSIPLSRII
jgi:nicotinamide mononucleotide transporter